MSVEVNDVMAFLHNCWIPAVHFTPSYLYPFGNSQMEDLLEDFVLKDRVDVLMLGVGDIRHILKTVGGVSVRAKRTKGTTVPSSMKFVINDNDSALIARDILLLRIVTDIDPNKEEDIEFLWDVWYNKMLLNSHHDRMKGILKKMVKTSASSDGDFWTFGDMNTKETVLHIMTRWLEQEEVVPEKNATVEFTLPALQLYPDAVDFLAPDSRFFDDWMNYEINHSTRKPQRDQRKVCERNNPTMYRPDVKIHSSAVDIRPWFSYFPMEREFLANFDSLYAACISVLQSVVKSFQESLKICKVNIVVWLEDALKLCHLRLPIEDSFDLVYTSNLSDYVGLMNVILACQPRLKRKDSVLMTEVFRWSYHFTTLEPYITAHLGCGPLLFPSIFGLRLAEDLEMGARSVKTTPSIHTMKTTCIQKLCWTKYLQVPTVLINLTESPDVQECLEHIVDLCCTHDGGKVHKYHFIDARNMYTPMTLIHVVRHMAERVQGGMQEIIRFINNLLDCRPHDCLSYNSTWNMLCWVYGNLPNSMLVVPDKVVVMHLDLNGFVGVEGLKQLKTESKLTGLVLPAKLILTTKPGEHEVFTTFSIKEEDCRISIAILLSTWKYLPDYTTYHFAIPEYHDMPASRTQPKLLKRYAIVKKMTNSLPPNVIQELSDLHTCTEFYDRYEIHIDVDNKGAKLSLNVNFTSNEKDEYKTDLTLDITWQNSKQVHTLKYSCGLDPNRSKFTLSSKRGRIDGVISKELEFHNIGRFTLPLRKIDKSELIPCNTKKKKVPTATMR